MSVLVLDSGNSIIKAKLARREQGEITSETEQPIVDTQAQSRFDQLTTIPLAETKIR